MPTRSERLADVARNLRAAGSNLRAAARLLRRYDADPDRACPHDRYAVDLDVRPLAGPDGRPVPGSLAELRIACADCREQFRFTGLPVGLAAGQPMVSPDHTELRAPIRPAAQDPDLGLGRPDAVTDRQDDTVE